MKKIGLLAAISSLPGSYGVGDFGKDAYRLIDILKENNFKVWQILPFHPLGYGNSPYQPYSSYAGDEIYISIEDLIQLKILNHSQITDKKIYGTSCDYSTARKTKEKYLKIAYNNLILNKELLKRFAKFKKDTPWLKNYAIFISLKKKNHMKCWVDWVYEDKDFINNPYELDALTKSSIEYEQFVQFIFYYQWNNLKKYANKNKVDILGDMPIYVGLDSADVWVNQQSFLLEQDGRPTFIAGVPPDYFSATGQRWGNPIYNWDYLKETNFSFWIERMKWAGSIYNITRIDHFRGFDTYWKIPSWCDTAVIGEWLEAPGYELFNEIYKQLPKIKIVVEDLGDLRKEVLDLRDYFNLSGMKVAQFELNSNEFNGSFNETKSTIIYPGTHDNQTTVGWYKSLDPLKKATIRKYLKHINASSTIDKLFLFCALSEAELVVFSVQDILKLGDSARMNTPGTISSSNWQWKLKDLNKFEKSVAKFKDCIKESKRI